jgi:glucan phosphorylase
MIMTAHETTKAKTGVPLLPTEIEGYDSLSELALDLRWSWNHYGDKVWRELDRDLWELTQNPWVVLQTVSPERLQTLLGEPGFRKEVDRLMEIKQRKTAEPAWFQRTHPESALSCIAYFSMEFMLSEALPIYSGGLGNVAGDQLKAASDLGVPVVGVGLLYQRGYFRQVIDQDGAQQALYPYNDPAQLPITPLRRPNGEWLRLEIVLPGYSVWVRAWEVQVGRVKLYLLDSNDAANFPAHRGITSELYGGGPELRLKQEMLLGIGGWRLLAELGIKPDICHLNEGHAAFAVLERARDFMQEIKQPFEVALAATRAGNLFTTHTAVAEALYERLEREVIPEFYTRNEKGIPAAWVARMRESMAHLTPRFSANRAVCEYTEQHYLPAAEAFRSRTANQGAIGRQLVDWRHEMEQKWASLDFGKMTVETRDGLHYFEIEIHLNGLDANAVRVELYADGINGESPVRQEMKRIIQPETDSSGTEYHVSVSSLRPATDYTARVIPHFAGIEVPLEEAHILWQK